MGVARSRGKVKSPDAKLDLACYEKTLPGSASFNPESTATAAGTVAVGSGLNEERLDDHVAGYNHGI